MPAIGRYGVEMLDVPVIDRSPDDAQFNRYAGAHDI
jgi:hypothetical protein